MRRRRLCSRRLGSFVQTNSKNLTIVGCLALLVLCLALRSTKFDTDLANWIQKTERVERELQTINSAVGSNSGSTSLLVLQAVKGADGNENQDNNPNVLSVNSLMVHLEALAIATHVTVDLYDNTWSLRDICFSPTPPDIDGLLATGQVMERVMPCAISTPLDCFWEASKLLGPEHDIRLDSSVPMPKWTELNPKLMVEARRRNHPHASFPYEAMLDWMQRVGITSGYVEKPCLDPTDPRCPMSAPNKHSREAPNVAAELTGGCYGLAANEMHWFEDEIMGGIKRNRSGFISTARALQSSIQLMDENDVYDYFDPNRGGLSIRNWSVEKAKTILETWQARYQEELEQFAKSSIASKSYKIFAMTSKSMLEPISLDSVTNATNLAAAICVMVLFTLVVFPRFEITSSPSDSNIDQSESTGAIITRPRTALLAVLACMITVITFAASLGLSCYWLLPFNLATSQILPPIALYYGFKQILLVANTYAQQLKLPDRPLSDLTVECIDELLPTVLIESVVFIVCLTVASVFQVAATRVLVCQALIYFTLSTVTTVILLPALMTSFIFNELNYCDDDEDSSDGAKTHKGLSIEDQILSRIQDDLKNIKADQNNLMTGTLPQNASCLPDLVLWPNFDVEANFRHQNNNQNSTQIDAHLNEFKKQVNEKMPDVDHGYDSTATNCQKSELFKLRRKKIVNFLARDAYVHTMVLLIRVGIFVAILSWASRVKYNLQVKDIIPRGTPEYDTFHTQDEYFPIYNVFAVTKGGFDYANNQQLLYNYYRRIEQVNGVLRDEQSNRPVFWLAYFRDWLIGLQEAFDLDRNNSIVSKEDMRDKSDNVRLAYKLLTQTGRPDDPVNQDNVWRNRLVDKNGIINQAAFYYYLPAWFMYDAYSYANSKANLKPEPKVFNTDLSNLKIDRARNITYAQIPFLMKLPADRDSLRTIVELRTISQAFEQLSLPNFLTGIPFIFWDQFINLDLLFFATVAITTASLFLIVGLMTSDFKLSAIILAPMVTTLLEIYGLMGIFSIEFNNVYAVMVISTIGSTVVQTIYFTSSFVKEEGDLVQRLGNSLRKGLRTVLTTLFLFYLCGFVFMFSRVDFMIKYSYILLSMATINAFNSLLITPIVLKIFGSMLRLDLNYSHDRLPRTPTPTKVKPLVILPRPRRHKKNRISKKYSGSKKHSKKRCYPRVQSEISLSTISEEP